MKKDFKDVKPRYVCGISLTGNPDIELLNECRKKGYGNTQIFREGMKKMLADDSGYEKSFK